MFLSAQRLDLFAWCVRLSRLRVGFWTHFKSLHFSFISFISYLVRRVFPLRDVPVGLADKQDDAGQRADEKQPGSSDTHDGQLDEVFVDLSRSDRRPCLDRLATSDDQRCYDESVTYGDDDERRCAHEHERQPRPNVPLELLHTPSQCARTRCESK